MPTRRDVSTDGGETLIELLVAIAVMGIAAVAIVGSLTTGILVSGIHRNEATAGAAVRGYAEAIETSIAAGNYVDCASTSSYSASAVAFAAPTGFVISAYTITYWTGSAWGSCTTPDGGVQRVTLTVSSADGKAVESLAVILRKPCATGSSCL